MRNTDTHSNACLVPTPDTPPVNRRGQGGNLTCVSTQPRQTRLCKTHLHKAGRRITSFPIVVLGSSETVEPCAAPQGSPGWDVCDTLSRLASPITGGQAYVTPCTP